MALYKSLSCTLGTNGSVITPQMQAAIQYVAAIALYLDCVQHAASTRPTNPGIWFTLAAALR
ncbi:hypothetical protein HJFPF1_12768 [Paramyrothecium foliicola]|nr:hypothetical protein HJFPF1_12768 [Paramyrothecium foliicola]